MKLIETDLSDAPYDSIAPRVHKRVEQAAQKSNAIKLGVSGNPHATGAAMGSFGWMEMRLLWQTTNGYDAEKALGDAINHATSLGFRAEVKNGPGDAEDIPEAETFFLYLMRR